MKFISILLFFLALLPEAFSSVTQEWIENNYTKQERMIPMRDGVRLYTAIYVPKHPDNSPVLIMRTPYSCNNYGQGFENFGRSYMRAYLERGYIIVKQDVRGRYLSEGTFEHIKPVYSQVDKSQTDETTDVYDTVEWLLANINGHNGRVGLVGNSYPGFYALMGGISGHPAIQAISPQAPVVDWFIGDDFHQNGALKLGDSFHFHNSFGKPHHGPTKKYPATVRHYENDEYTFFLEQGTLRNIGSLFGDSISFWSDMVEHPHYDDWWKQRNALAYSSQINVPVLIAGGFYDAEDAYGAFSLYRHLAEKGNKSSLFLAAGPWSHGQWRSASAEKLGKLDFGENTARWFQDSIEVPFFDAFLRNQTTFGERGNCHIFLSGSNRKVIADTWPLANTRPVSFFLQQGGDLSEEHTSRTTQKDYVSNPATPVPYSDRVAQKRNADYMVGDQRFASRRPDVLTYRSEPLSADMTVAGQALIDLNVKTTTSDADFVVKIIDEYPADVAGRKEMNSYQMLIRGEVMRGRYRKGMDKPVPLKTGKTENITWETVDMGHTFKKGHRIVIQIQSSWFPLIDRNPQQFVDIYTCKESDFIPSGITVVEGGRSASRIVLPVVEGM